ncbi:amidohydrolase [Halomonas sp. M4R1S46]|uniref:amidohydrolase n=1 Tax=Halomonas sp. M4R1S46 TaxID=2982692 RepID=UPI0021E4B10E|nr:amidohydrolase [Halomonas sp. M4R1S46]UYG07135.1 amidohydrolase [Halomonas sp. M4R1S46]
MRIRKVLSCAALTAGYIGAASASSDIDLILHDAKVRTMDDAIGVVEAVAISGNRVSAVGSNEEVLALRDDGVRVIDLDGRTVIPGLVDTHLHLDEVGENLQKIQTNDLRSLQVLLGRIAAEAERLSDGGWIVGASDWHESQLEENRFPSREELDEVAPDNPVFLRRGGINAVINSKAMEVAGIDEEDADPPGGKYDRDESGRFSGWIQSFSKVNEIAGLLPAPSEEQVRSNFLAAMQALSSKGVTTVRSQHVSPDHLASWRAIVDDGGHSLRGVAMMSINPRAPLEQDIASLEEHGISPGMGDDDLRVGGLKVTHDGGVETALLREEYTNIPGFKGIEVTPLEKVERLSAYACENGWGLSVHAIGGQAITNVLNAWNELNDECSLADLGWGLEHPYLPNASDIELMRELSVTPHTQAPHNYTLGAGFLEFWGEERTHRSIPNRTYIDAGVLPAAGTDSPVAPFDPFLSMWVEVTRQTAAAGVLGAEEAVTPLESLKMHTIWAAQGLGMEDRIGSISPGKYADMVVLSDDPLSVAPEELRKISADWTFFSGEAVHQP